MINYFEVLNVAENAELEVIRASYKALGKKYHPDNTDLPPDVANKKMALINEAYDVLSDENKRKKHLQELHAWKQVNEENAQKTESEKNKENTNIKVKKKKPFFKRIWFWLVVIGLLGSVFSDDSDGEKSQSVYNVNFHILYEEATGLNYRDDLKLYIDDNEIGEVEYGSEIDYEVELKEGEHEIYLRRDATLRKSKSNVETVDVSENNTYIKVIAREDTIKGLVIEVYQNERVFSDELVGNEKLNTLRKKANAALCTTQVYEDKELKISCVEDDENYFDEIVLNAWFDKKGEPIADVLPLYLQLVVEMEGGNLSRYIQDFHFINNTDYTFEMLSQESADSSAMYAVVLKNLYNVYQTGTSDVIGMIGWDYITDTLVNIEGAFESVNEGDVILLLADYKGRSEEDSYKFRAAYCENITHLFTEDELKNDKENLEFPISESNNLGTFGTELSVSDIKNFPVNEQICFEGVFKPASNNQVGAFAVYTESINDNSKKYLFFVEPDNEAYRGREEGYGFIEEDIAWQAHMSYSGEVTDDLLESVVASWFEDEKAERIEGKISKVDKIQENYYICYMESVKRSAIDIYTVNNSSNKAYVGSGDTFNMYGLECTITDVGMLKDESYGTTVYIDMNIEGEPYASLNEIIDTATNMTFWGDGKWLADYPVTQIAGENILFGNRYSLDFKGNKESLKFFAFCPLLEYDMASEVIAEFGEVNIIIKGDAESIKKRSDSKTVSQKQNGSSSKINYEKIYGELKDTIVEEENSRTGDAEYLAFCLYDMNNDGYKEFITETNFDEVDKGFTVYTTDGVDVIEVGNISGRRPQLYEYADKNGIYAYSPNYGNNYECIKLYRMVDGVLQEELVVEKNTQESQYLSNREELSVSIPLELMDSFEVVCSQ